MKKIILTFVLPLMIACQTKQIGTSSNALSMHNPIDPKSAVDPIERKLWCKKKTLDVQQYRFLQHLSGNLIVHSKFLFLEDVDMQSEDIGNLQSVRKKYSTESELLTPYKIKDQAILDKYKHLMGKEITINNYNRDQYTATVIDLVLIEDRMVRNPYVAAVLDEPKGKNIYYAWTTTGETIAYPYEKTKSDWTAKVRLKFENSSAFGYFEETYETREKDHSEITVQSFEHYEGEEYFVAQYNVVGNCSSLIDNLVAVFKKKNGKINLIAVNTIDYFFIDLVDINGDDFPELLGGDFSSTVIYSIENGEIEEVKQLSWSTEGCPC